MKQKMTYETAFAAAQDEGNRHAKRHGRTAWNVDDYNAAAKRLEDLITKSNIRAVTG